MANGRVRRQHGHEAVTMNKKLFLGRLESRGRQTRMPFSIETICNPGDTSRPLQSLSLIWAAGLWPDPRTEQSHLFKVVRALPSYNVFSGGSSRSSRTRACRRTERLQRRVLAVRVKGLLTRQRFEATRWSRPYLFGARLKMSQCFSTPSRVIASLIHQTVQ